MSVVIKTQLHSNAQTPAIIVYMRNDDSTKFDIRLEEALSNMIHIQINPFRLSEVDAVEICELLLTLDTLSLSKSGMNYDGKRSAMNHWIIMIIFHYFYQVVWRCTAFRLSYIKLAMRVQLIANIS